MGPGPLWDSRAPLTPGRSARIVNECMDWYWRLDASEEIFWSLVGVFGWCLWLVFVRIYLAAWVLPGCQGCEKVPRCMY